MSPRALHKRCVRLLADLPMPSPFRVDALVRNMEDARGRSIHLVELAEPEGGPRAACGLRVRTDQVTYVLYRRRPTQTGTEHTILHELCHEWFDHGTTLSRQEIERYVPGDLYQGLLGRLGPGAVVQARARYDTPEEQEAELSASLIKRIARQRPSVGEDMVSLLEHSLSHPVAPPRLRGTR
ncbi:hypothetical protein AV521_13185 [Streptomyces sp. IMTB 2501]|nr:hypothetical protein AV521_13185 [Streptomyces sp. IMTB 2501]